jgi:hypothetical protein
MMPSRAQAAADAAARFEALPEIGRLTNEWFLRQGVLSSSLVYPELPRRARVVFSKDLPLFDFSDEDGERVVQAVVFLARDQDGEIADLVAWSPSPPRLASWQGATALLGAEEILAPRLTQEAALWVHMTPLDWLKSDREGVVIIDPTRAYLALRDFGPFFAHCDDQALELLKLFKPREPRIYVPVSEARGAA